MIAPVPVKQLKGYVDGLVQDCSNSITNALELLQSCTKPSMLCVHRYILSKIVHIDCSDPGGKIKKH